MLRLAGFGSGSRVDTGILEDDALTQLGTGHDKLGVVHVEDVGLVGKRSDDHGLACVDIHADAVLHVVGTAGDTPVGEVVTVGDEAGLTSHFRILLAEVGAGDGGSRGIHEDLEGTGRIAAVVNQGDQVLLELGLGGGHGVGHLVLHDDVTEDGIRIESQLAGPVHLVRGAVLAEEDALDVVDIVQGVGARLRIGGGALHDHAAGFHALARHLGLARDEVAVLGDDDGSLDVGILSQVVLVAHQDQLDRRGAIQGHRDQTAGLTLHAGRFSGSESARFHHGRRGEHARERIQDRLVASGEAQEAAANQQYILFHNAFCF